MSKNDLHKRLINLLKKLHLPMFREYYAEFAQKAIAEDMGYAQYLFELAQRECEVRRANKIARLVKASKLPMEKTMANFDLKRLPYRQRRFTLLRAIRLSSSFSGPKGTWNLISC